MSFYFSKVRSKLTFSISQDVDYFHLAFTNSGRTPPGGLFYYQATSCRKASGPSYKGLSKPRWASSRHDGRLPQYGNSKRKQSRNHCAFYDLVMGIMDCHFYIILLVTQISYSLRESDIHKNVNIRRQGLLWAILKAGYNYPIPQQPVQYWPVVGT